MKIRYGDRAEHLYHDAIAYLFNRNPNAAKSFVGEVERMEDRLCDFPLLGSPIPEFPNSAYKQCFVSPYRFFYRVDDRAECVVITAVYHDKQIPAKPE
jgi:plasmid stabilization system protein ParE